MFDKSSLRSALLAVVFGLLCMTAGYQYAWHQNNFDLGSSLESVGWLVTLLVAIGLVIWVFLGEPTRLKSMTAVVVTAITIFWGNRVLDGIDTNNLLILLGSGLVFNTFVVLLSAKNLSLPSKFNRRSAPADDVQSSETRQLDVVPDEATVS